METRRFAFRLFYLGRNYQGIQYQPSPQVYTIIKVIYNALQRCQYISSPKDNNVQFAGRTDKGVNSLANTVAFTTNQSEFRESFLNDALPPDLCVWASAEVPLDFNPRTWAIGREYRYFLPRYGVNAALDIDQMRVAAKLFLGEHDYKYFSKPDPEKPTWSSINEISIIPEDDYYEFRFFAKSFLWMQVRKIVQVLREVGAGIQLIEKVQTWLDVKEPASIQPINADGLYLWDVRYPESVRFVIREGYLKRIWHNISKEKDAIERKSRSYAGFLASMQSLLP